MNIRLPNITADTERGKLEQIRSYLYQMACDLNFALGTAQQSATESQKPPVSAKQATGAAAQAVFPEIKSLIIKSADIVNAYYDEISKRLEGVYVAESDYGTFAQQTTQDIKANYDSIESIFTDLQAIEGVKSSLIDVNAHIKAGHLYDAQDGSPVYGLEVGQRTEIDGQEVFNKYAQFTSEKLSFYDQNGTEVAYISDRNLYITSVEIEFSLTMGGLVEEVQADGSIIGRWR